MKRISLILCVIFILLSLTACGSDEALTSAIENEVSSLIVDTESDTAEADEAVSSAEQEEKVENIIPIAGSDVSVTQEPAEDTEEEEIISEEEEKSDNSAEESAEENSGEEETEEPFEVYTPIDVTIVFNHELVKDADEHDILDLRTSIPYIQSGSCEGADAINAYFANKAFYFSDYIKNSISEASEENTELHTAEMVCSITFNRNGLLSIVLDSYSYSGNNESTVSRDCALFDINTGEKLTLWQVVDNANLDSLFSHVVSSYSPAELSDKFDENMFSLTENGLMVSFPSETLDEGQKDIEQFTIPYDVCALKIDLSQYVPEDTEEETVTSGEEDE